MTLEASEIVAFREGGRSVRAKPSAVPHSLRALKSAALRLAAVAALFALVGCREVRVKTFAQGTVTVPGGNQIVVVRDPVDLAKMGIHAPVHFRGEFGVILLMGPHARTGYKQIIESIRANDQRVRVVAFEQAPADGGEPSANYRTYTLWIVPNSVYRRGIRVEVVTPSDESIASTFLP
jgi:hypothetical protein